MTDLRDALEKRGLDRSGSKAELIERVVAGEVLSSEVLGELDREKLSGMCAGFGLKPSGAKAELVQRLVEFYDDLTFEEHASPDEREAWYADYELLAARAYAELRAKKLITKDLDIQYMFEDATAFLFEVRLRVPCDMSRKDSRSDGRLGLDAGQSLLWDCKSVEGGQPTDFLDGRFDGYLEGREGRRNYSGSWRSGRRSPIADPGHKYKARTNWDVALVTSAGLKHLAERWAATEPEKPFPIRLLIRTEVIDKERAEFLLSLA